MQQTPGAAGFTRQIPRSLSKQLDRFAQNRRLVEQDMLDKENRKHLKEQRQQQLYRKVQSERLLNSGKDRASVAACKDEKSRHSQETRMLLRQAIDISSEMAQEEIDTKVRLTKMQTAGRVAAARQALLAQKKAARLEVAKEQKFALDEKARRLETLRAEHAEERARRFVPWTSDEVACSDAAKYLVLSRIPSVGGGISVVPSLALAGTPSAAGSSAAAARGQPAAAALIRPSAQRAHDVAIAAASVRSAAAGAVLPPELRSQ